MGSVTDMDRVDSGVMLPGSYRLSSNRDGAVRVGIAETLNFFLDIGFRVCYNGRK